MTIENLTFSMIIIKLILNVILYMFFKNTKINLVRKRSWISYYFKNKLSVNCVIINLNYII